MAFCVDTSAWLDGWRRYYPREVTGTAEKPRIPFVCTAEGIRCISFLDMIRELRLTF